jgi:hypothetical protein
MLVEEAMVARMKADAALKVRVGQRIFPAEQALEGEALPLILYGTVENVPAITHDGASTSDKNTFDVTIWAADYADCKRVLRSLRNLWHGYRGAYADFWFQGVFLRGGYDEYEQPQHDDERGLFSLTVTLEVWCNAQTTEA